MNYRTFKNVLLTSVASISVAVNALAVTEPAIIPMPRSMSVKEGFFTLKSDMVVCTDEASRETAEYLAVRLRRATGYQIKVNPSQGKTAGKGGILITTADAKSSLGSEGYEFTATRDNVVIRAPEQAGLFYGVQTLLQLLPPRIFSVSEVKDTAWTVPCVTIEDRPRFAWRGLMLDVSRHFFTKDEVKRLLDVMALHKINTFHWHLVDNDGWRIEIKKYPKLTEVGAWRKEIGYGFDAGAATAYGPDGRYGGYYTQDEVREIVAYAGKLHITVVPEIEMPGHSGAVLEAYPELGSGGTGVSSQVYSAGKEETFDFLQNVLTEVFGLFPSKYIHIGGDEVPKGAWEKDIASQELMRKEGLKNQDELQSYFIRRIEKFINANKKTLLGWSEILHGGLAPNAAVMDWIGGGLEAASQGHDVVMTPTTHCYFDYCQSVDRAAEPRTFGGFLPLEKVYFFEPIPDKLPSEMQKHILGAQGNVWTEYMPNFKQVEYMIFPRLCALAEVTWSPKEERNFDAFISRLRTDTQRLDQLGVHYRPYRTESITKIGDWKPGQIKKEGASLEWDITKNLTSAGSARVIFLNTGGAGQVLDILSVKLFEDAVEIGRDSNVSSCRGGHGTKPVCYTFDVPTPKRGSHYTLRAQVSVGSGGTGASSPGTLFWDLKPTPR